MKSIVDKFIFQYKNNKLFSYNKKKDIISRKSYLFILFMNFILQILNYNIPFLGNIKESSILGNQIYHSIQRLKFYILTWDIVNFNQLNLHTRSCIVEYIIIFLKFYFLKILYLVFIILYIFLLLIHYWV